MTPLRLITLAGDSEREAVIAARLSKSDEVELYLRCVDRVELVAAVRGGDIDGLISVGAPSWFDAPEAGEARARGVRIVAVADNALESEVLTRLGIEVLDVEASSGDIVKALLSGPQAPAIPEPAPRREGIGRILSVWGPKGSPGRSTVALELACCLAATEQRTLLVDADPYGGDLLQMLGIVEELPTVLWASQMAAKGELGVDSLARYLRRAGDGPVFLPGLPRAELWPEVSDYGWREFLISARSQFVHIICDVGFCLEAETGLYPGGDGGRNRLARATLAASDRVLAVCGCNPVGVKNFIWSHLELRNLVDEDSVTIVLNRLRGDRGEIDDLLLRHIGRRSAVAIPDASAELARAVGDGASVVGSRPSSQFAGSVRELAGVVGGRVEARGFLARLSGRS